MTDRSDAEGVREAWRTGLEIEPGQPFRDPNEVGIDPGDPAKKLRLDPDAPLRTAKVFLALRHMRDGMRALHHRDGMFFVYTGTHYAPVSSDDLRAQLYGFAGSAFCTAASGYVRGQLRPFNPDRKKMLDVLEALKAACHIGDETLPPCWLDEAADLPPEGIIPCANGLLKLDDRELIPHTPCFFSTYALNFSYSPTAAPPATWLALMKQIFPGPAGEQSIEALQEFFGYWLTPDTRQQKGLIIVGPKRSGKGTLARIVSGLLGEVNVAAPTLSALAQNFGLEPLIGKLLAIVSDARLGDRMDQAATVERLLSIMGEDRLTIDRKHRSAWTGRLSTRFLILTNELPRLRDASGALASRFIVLNLTESYYGREDHDLTVKLLAELPGIFLWAIEGLQRLRERGRFVQPESSAEVVQDLEDLGSPVRAFVRDCCELSADAEVSADTLYTAFVAWCSNEGRRSGSKPSFLRDLRAAEPGLSTRRLRDSSRATRDNRVRICSGVRLLAVTRAADSEHGP